MNLTETGGELFMCLGAFANYLYLDHTSPSLPYPSQELVNDWSIYEQRWVSPSLELPRVHI